MAFDILRHDGDGRLEALFERCIYVSFGRGWVCLGADTLPMGPMNARTAVTGKMVWQSFGLRVGDAVSSRQGVIRLAPHLAFSLGHATIWDPPPVPDWTPTSLQAGLAALDRLGVDPDADGLGAYAGAERQVSPANRTATAARRPIAQLAVLLRRRFANDPPGLADVNEPVTALLGLGPGLTPSGDDFLGGMMIALRALGADDMQTQLFAVINRLAPGRTNPVSIAHLRAAGTGAGHQSLHDTLHALLIGDAKALPGNLAAMDRIGHSSGRDALAGLCVTLRAVAAS